MLDYQKRIVDEKIELDDKLCKLEAFMDDEAKFSKVGILDRYLLQYQRDAMKLYSSTLKARIDHFPEA